MTVIKQKSSGIWQIRFQLDGRKFQKSSKSKKKSIALDVERQWRNELVEKKLFGKQDEISFYDALEMFQESKTGMKTYDDMCSKIRTVKQYFKDMPIHELSTKDLERFVLTRKREGKAGQTIEHGIIQVRGCWSYAKKLGYRVSLIHFPKIKINNQRVRCLTREDEKKLLKELSPNNVNCGSILTPISGRKVLLKQRQDNYDLVILLLDLGCRYSEAILRWTQVDLDKRTINLKRTKTNNESILMMSNRIYEILVRRYENKTNDIWVFTDNTGTKPRNHATISIRRAIKRAGIEDFRVHDLRHTTASRLVRNGVSLQEVALILGHKNLSTTMRYSHLHESTVASKMKNVIDAYNEGK